MKIGIVTQPLIGNFGGILQNFALQQILIRHGHQPITFDFFHTIPWKDYFKILIKNFITFFSKGEKLSILSRHKYRKQGLADDFIAKYIYITSPIFKYSKSDLHKFHFDAIIAGSDQIWRPLYNTYLEDMYLKFTQQSSVKKIAYAASFGVEYKEYSPELIDSCIHYARNLDAVSVRESSGIALCKDYFGIDAYKVLDPTLLLTAGDYSTILNLPTKKREDSLVAYILDRSDEKNRIIKHITTNLNIKRIDQIYENDSDYSPVDWLSMFASSSYIITDSFHGTVFSIIFHIPFLSIVNSERGADRFTSLLTPLGLQSRLIDATKPFNFNPGDIKHKIDWHTVDEQLQTLREFSINFLIRSLNNCN